MLFFRNGKEGSTLKWELRTLEDFGYEYYELNCGGYVD